MRRVVVGLAGAAAATAVLVTVKGPLTAGRPAPAGAVSSCAPASPPADARTVDGPVSVNQFGPVQVKVSIAGDRIVDVAVLQAPNSHIESVNINNFATPKLRQEALGAQSAHIDTVSGATDTSESYRTSLRAALDAAGFKPPACSPR